jgi:hypothetical protein
MVPVQKGESRIGLYSGFSRKEQNKYYVISHRIVATYQVTSDGLGMSIRKYELFDHSQHIMDRNSIYKLCIHPPPTHMITDQGTKHDTT